MTYTFFLLFNEVMGAKSAKWGANSKGVEPAKKAHIS